MIYKIEGKLSFKMQNRFRQRQFHESVYTWGFLVVLVGMWLLWFLRFGGPARTLDASKSDPSPWRFERRRQWERRHTVVLGVAALMFVLAMTSMFTDQEAVEARETLTACQFSSLLSSQCSDAQLRWDDAIGYAWSFSAIGLAMLFGTVVVIQRPLEDGTWASEKMATSPSEEAVQTEKSHHKKRSGSWKNRGEEE